MDDETYEKLSDIACHLSGMTAILTAYCEHFDDKNKEVSNLVEFSQIMNKKTEEIFELL